MSDSGRVEVKGSNRSPSVFVSYSRSDAAFVNDLIEWLREAGCTVWQDTSGLRGGQAWSQGIDQAVRSCDVFVIVLSPASSISDWVLKETLLGMKLHKPIVPILFRDTEIPVQLVDLQFIDFRENRNEANQKLLEAISASTNSHHAIRKTPLAVKRYVKPVVLSLLGVVILGAIVYLTLSTFRSKSNDNKSVTTSSDSPGSSPTSVQPSPTPSASASEATEINKALGTFTTEFQKKDGVYLVSGYTLGGLSTCFYHNIKLSEQDVGKLLNADVGHIDISDENSDAIELRLYRSLVGPWKSGQSVDLFEKPVAEIVGFKQDGPQGLSWKVTQAGNYVLCLQVRTNQYEDGEGNPKPGFRFARYTVLLSGN